MKGRYDIKNCDWKSQPLSEEAIWIDASSRGSSESRERRNTSVSLLCSGKVGECAPRQFLDGVFKGSSQRPMAWGGESLHACSPLVLP